MNQGTPNTNQCGTHSTAKLLNSHSCGIIFGVNRIFLMTLPAQPVMNLCCYYSTPCVYTYLLTPWCRVLLEKLTGLQLVKKFPAFYGSRRFITALTSVRHLSVSWASPIQSIYQHPTSWRSVLILSTHLCLGLPSVLFHACIHTYIHNTYIQYVYRTCGTLM